MRAQIPRVTLCFTSCAQLRPLAVEKHCILPPIGQYGDTTTVTGCSVQFTLACFFCPPSIVCGSLYEVLTGLPESEMPYHFYTDQRFALVLLCLFLILPLSIPKEISIQKYIRLAPRCVRARTAAVCTAAAGFRRPIFLQRGGGGSGHFRPLQQPVWFLFVELVSLAVNSLENVPCVSVVAAASSAPWPPPT